MKKLNSTLIKKKLEMLELAKAYEKFESMEGTPCLTCWQKGCDCPESDVMTDEFVNNYNYEEEVKICLKIINTLK